MQFIEKNSFNVRSAFAAQPSLRDDGKLSRFPALVVFE